MEIRLDTQFDDITQSLSMALSWFLLTASDVPNSNIAKVGRLICSMHVYWDVIDLEKMDSEEEPYFMTVPWDIFKHTIFLHVLSRRLKDYVLIFTERV